jgi:hypothetical protein
MEPILERLRFREIEKLLYSQLHQAQETSRIAGMNDFPKPDRDKAAESLRVAFDRWQALISRREIPDDLKDWRG